MRFVWVGKTRDSRLRALEEDYLSRIGKVFPCDRIHARPSSDGSDARQRQREGEDIRARLSTGGYNIVWDEGGTLLDSRDFSALISSLADGSTREVNFVVGGHLGLDSTVLETADRRLSLSRMTFPHELCRVLVLEQVYRACSIRNRTPYHK